MTQGSFNPDYLHNLNMTNLNPKPQRKLDIAATKSKSEFEELENELKAIGLNPYLLKELGYTDMKASQLSLILPTKTIYACYCIAWFTILTIAELFFNIENNPSLNIVRSKNEPFNNGHKTLTTVTAGLINSIAFPALYLLALANVIKRAPNLTSEITKAIASQYNKPIQASLLPKAILAVMCHHAKNVKEKTKYDFTWKALGWDYEKDPVLKDIANTVTLDDDTFQNIKTSAQSIISKGTAIPHKIKKLTSKPFTEETVTTNLICKLATFSFGSKTDFDFRTAKDVLNGIFLDYSHPGITTVQDGETTKHIISERIKVKLPRSLDILDDAIFKNAAIPIKQATKIPFILNNEADVKEAIETTNLLKELGITITSELDSLTIDTTVVIDNATESTDEIKVDNQLSDEANSQIINTKVETYDTNNNPTSVEDNKEKASSENNPSLETEDNSSSEEAKAVETTSDTNKSIENSDEEGTLSDTEEPPKGLSKPSSPPRNKQARKQKQS